MRLIHYSDAPLVSVYSVAQSGKEYMRHAGRKPIGLWVSVEGEDDWRKWCEAEKFRDVSSQVATEIVLCTQHHVSIIDTSEALCLFNAEFGYRDEHTDLQGIDWPRVAGHHDGVIIAPYQWGHRLGGPIGEWYYGWDCASGCIWNGNAVREVRQLAPR